MSPNATVTTSYSEIYAEAVRVISLQGRAQDAGQIDDLLSCYTGDAVIEIPGVASLTGSAAIREAFSQPGWSPDPQRPQRHLITNTIVTSWSDDEAEVSSDVVMLVREGPTWSAAMVARYFDTLVRQQGRWLIRRRIDEFA